MKPSWVDCTVCERRHSCKKDKAPCDDFVLSLVTLNRRGELQR